MNKRVEIELYWPSMFGKYHLIFKHLSKVDEITGMYLQIKSKAFMVTGLFILAFFASAIGEFSVLGDFQERQYT